VPSGQGFVNSYKLDCTTADASLSAGDVLIVGYRMEGIELQRLNYGTSGAKNTVLSFWVKTNKTGNYVVQFQNIRSTIRTCSLLYTVSSANTWQKVEFPIPADTAATFDNDNLLSGILYWWLAAGTDWTSGTLNTTWADRVNANNAAGLNVNLADSTDNEWYITGIQLEEGDVATAFEHEDYGTTLAKCQRYYMKWLADTAYDAAFAGFTLNSTQFFGTYNFPCEMRGVPTMAVGGNWNVFITGGDYAASSFQLNQATPFNMMVYAASSGMTAGSGGLMRTNNDDDAYVEFISEL
jgi:hypothetical protein